MTGRLTVAEAFECYWDYVDLKCDLSKIHSAKLHALSNECMHEYSMSTASFRQVAGLFYRSKKKPSSHETRYLALRAFFETVAVQAYMAKDIGLTPAHFHSAAGGRDWAVLMERLNQETNVILFPRPVRTRRAARWNDQ